MNIDPYGQEVMSMQGHRACLYTVAGCHGLRNETELLTLVLYKIPKKNHLIRSESS